MKILFSFLLTILCIGFSGCASMKLEDYSQKTPLLNFKDHFIGTHQGSGIFYDRFGRARMRFTIEIVGRQTEQGLVLAELLTYETGEIVKRDYEIKQLSASQFEVRTADIVGVGLINTSGNAAQWRYTLKQKIGNKIWNLRFDDWMFLNADHSIVNRAWASFWGLGVGEVHMVLRKTSK
jgi:hypothetical protein